MPSQRVPFFERLVRVANRGEPDRPAPGLEDLLSQQGGSVDLDINERSPRFAVAAVPRHEQSGVAIDATDLATGIGIDAVIVDLRGVENGLGLDLADDGPDMAVLYSQMPDGTARRASLIAPGSSGTRRWRGQRPRRRHPYA